MRAVGCGRGATFAVDPAGVAVLVVLLFPDGHSMFNLVDDVSTGLKCLSAVAGADAYPHGHFADRQVTDAVYACGVLDAETVEGFGDDAFAFLDSERLEGFVLEVTD